MKLASISSLTQGRVIKVGVSSAMKCVQAPSPSAILRRMLSPARISHRGVCRLGRVLESGTCYPMLVVLKQQHPKRKIGRVSSAKLAAQGKPAQSNAT